MHKMIELETGQSSPSEVLGGIAEEAKPDDMGEKSKNPMRRKDGTTL